MALLQIYDGDAGSSVFERLVLHLQDAREGTDVFANLLAQDAGTLAVEDADLIDAYHAMQTCPKTSAESDPSKYPMQSSRLLILPSFFSAKLCHFDESTKKRSRHILTSLAKIFVLFLSEFVDFQSPGCEFPVGDIQIDFAWHIQHGIRQLALVPCDVTYAESLDSEAHVQVSSNVEWWIYLRPSFLMMSPLDSVGDADLKIYVTANPKTDARDTVMQITTQTIRHKIVIHQDPNPGN